MWIWQWYTGLDLEQAWSFGIACVASGWLLDGLGVYGYGIVYQSGTVLGLERRLDTIEACLGGREYPC